MTQPSPGFWTSGPFVAPLRPTWERYRDLCSRSMTLMRSLQYERIKGLALSGRILDVGGGRAFDYLPLLRITGQVDSVNLNVQRRPTVVADLNAGFPWASDAYDHVISFNTLEHLRDDQHAVREIFRVLKPGGSFHILVPFVYRVHAAPYDHHRHTAFWWAEFLQRAVAPATLAIEPLVWSPVSSACAQFNWFRGRRGRLLKRALLLPAVVAQRGAHGERMSMQETADAAPHALAYYISGTR